MRILQQFDPHLIGAEHVDVPIALEWPGRRGHDLRQGAVSEVGQAGETRLDVGHEDSRVRRTDVSVVWVDARGVRAAVLGELQEHAVGQPDEGQQDLDARIPRCCFDGGPALGERTDDLALGRGAVERCRPMPP